MVGIKRFKLVLPSLLTACVLFNSACSSVGVEIDYSNKPCAPAQITRASLSEPPLSLIVDQANVSLVKPFYYNVYRGPMGQEFIPGLHAIDAIELNLADASCSKSGGNGGKLLIRIREAGMNGKVIGVSDTMHFANCFSGVMRFDFPNFISVVPGKKYVFEPIHISGNTFLFYLDEGPSNYRQGRFILDGNAEVGKDMWFQEGLYTAVARTETQIAREGWKRIVRNDGTSFKSEAECINYISGLE